MKITVAFYAQSREIAGKNQMDFEIPEGEDVSGLLKRLRSQFHDLADVQMMVAVNTEYVQNNHRLHEGDKVAIIPPINGG
jgi:molybdopterin converting factor subunit 1